VQMLHIFSVNHSTMHYKHSFPIFLVINLQKKQNQTTYFELSCTCAKLLFFCQSEEIVIL